MNKWKHTSIGEFIDFNPSESIKKGELATKIGMDKLGTFQRKIDGSELVEYSAGPKFRNGDTVVAKITPCLENGKTAYVDILNDDEVAFGSSEFIVLRENENSDSKFIYYLARSPLFRERAISCMEGTSGRKRVNEGALKRQEILVPNLPTQQKIASVLSALDDKIELNNKINAVLEHMAKTLYDYWFVQFDFPNAKGKPYKSSGGKMVYNETLKREIPEGWEVKKLGEVSYSNRNQISAKASWTFLNYLDTSNITNNSIDKIITYDLQMAPSRAKRIVEENDIVYSTVRPIQRHFGIIKKPVANMVVSTGFTVLSHKTNKVFNNFIYQFLSSESVVNHLQDIAQNRVSSYPSINPDDIMNLELCLPKHNEMVLEKISLQLNNIYNRINSSLQQNQELAQLRDWLLPMLMNGQVTVAEDLEGTTEQLGMVAEQPSQYTTNNKSEGAKEKRFSLWLSEQKIAARGEIDMETLRVLFDAMDEDEQ